MIRGRALIGLAAALVLLLPGAAWAAAPGKIAFVSTRDGDADIFRMNADGSGQTQLTSNSDDPAGEDTLPVWSPDGKRIAFLSRRDAGLDNEIWVMNADGSEQRQLTFNSEFEGSVDWAPDGRTLVFSGPGPSDDLFLINADGSPLRQLTFSPAANAHYDVSFSPTGEWILFLNQGTMPQDDYTARITPAGTGLQNLTAFDAYLPEYSGDGKRITFESNANPLGSNPEADSEIFSMSADGTDLRQVTTTGGGLQGADGFPTPSHDGLDRITFSSFRDGINREIFLMQADGSGVTQLTNTAAPAQNFYPDMQPTATCQGKVATVVGTAASETLAGGPNADIISGQGGKDRITGLDGDDIVCGDAGRDTLLGGNGRDTLNGGKGNDRAVGGKGRDRCIGGKGSRDRAKSCEARKKIP